MPRKSRSARKQVQGWLSANQDNLEPNGYIPIGSSLLESNAFQELTAGAQIVYLYCCAAAKGNRTFYFPKRTAEKVYGLNWSTTCAALKTLQEKGFLRKNYSGRVTREPNQYEFIFAWKEMDLD